MFVVHFIETTHVGSGHIVNGCSDGIEFGVIQRGRYTDVFFYRIGLTFFCVMFKMVVDI